MLVMTADFLDEIIDPKVAAVLRGTNRLVTLAVGGPIHGQMVATPKVPKVDVPVPGERGFDAARYVLVVVGKVEPTGAPIRVLRFADLTEGDIGEKVIEAALIAARSPWPEGLADAVH